MNYHYGFFDAPAVPAYPNSTPAMKPAIYFIKPPCLADANYECLGCDIATLRNNGSGIGTRSSLVSLKLL